MVVFRWFIYAVFFDDEGNEWIRVPFACREDLRDSVAGFDDIQLER